MTQNIKTPWTPTIRAGSAERPQTTRSALSRRDFLTVSAAAAGFAHTANAFPAEPTSTLRPAVASDERAGKKHDWSKLRGFNYFPSYGSSGLELWQKFDAKTIEIELGQAKKYFPGMNALRWWQSWESFSRNPKLYAQNFETTLKLAEQHQCSVIPVLVNRWHDNVLDFGGIYIDNFIPGSFSSRPDLLHPFIDALVGEHKDDSRILAWDLCNEPYWYLQDYPIAGVNANAIAGRERISGFIPQAETAWLKALYKKCKDTQCSAPLTVGSWAAIPLELVNPVSDILSIHPYWRHDLKIEKSTFEEMLDGYVAYARKVNKPLISTECCWGDLSDTVRAEASRYELAQLIRRGIGFVPAVLHHSLVADSHRPEFDYVGTPGYLGFIEADGSLRRRHAFFNEF